MRLTNSKCSCSQTSQTKSTLWSPSMPVCTLDANALILNLTHQRLVSLKQILQQDSSAFSTILQWVALIRLFVNAVLGRRTSCRSSRCWKRSIWHTKKFCSWNRHWLNWMSKIRLTLWRSGKEKLKSSSCLNKLKKSKRCWHRRKTKINTEISTKSESSMT